MIAALVEGKLARAQHGKPATCPKCHGHVYARLPEHAIRHWAHTPLPEGETRACAHDSDDNKQAESYAEKDAREYYLLDLYGPQEPRPQRKPKRKTAK